LTPVIAGSFINSNQGDKRMFQQTVNTQPSPAVEGDYASQNPRTSVLAGPGGLVAGPGGVTVGAFAWIEADGHTVQSFGTNNTAPDGFVHREQQALITQFLGSFSMNVPEGFPITLDGEGDFWVRNQGPAAFTKGATVFASFATGLAFTSAPAGATATGSIGATFTATAGTPTTQLVVTAVTGLISIGDTLSGTGITAGTTVVSQVSGTPGGAGTYVLSAANTAAAATVTSFGDVLDVTAVTGVLAIGDPISGTGVPAGAALASQVSGAAGGVGVYTITLPATAYAASTALTTTGGIATNFKAYPNTPGDGAVGSLVKISTWNQ
jgi:hypothetical protein